MDDVRILTEIKRTKSLMSYKPNNKKINEEVLDEGVKDWVLGASLIMASILNPGNVDAHIGHLPKEKTDSTITAIKSIIGDQNKLDQVAHYLKEKGVTTGGKGTIVNYGKKIIDKIEQNKGTKGFTVDTVHTQDPREMVRLLKTGKYALTSANIQTVIDTIYPDVKEIPVQEFNLPGKADDFFEFGRLELKEGIKAQLQQAIDSIINAGNIITGVRIISGTDFVRVTPGGDLNKLGINNNQELATERGNVIQDYIESLGVDSSLSTVCTFPNNIENKQGYEPNESLRIAGVKIESVKIQPEPTDTISTQKHTTSDFELVGISGEKSPSTISASSVNKGSIPSRGNIKTKIKQAIGKPIKCPSFGNNLPTFGN